MTDFKVQLNDFSRAWYNLGHNPSHGAGFLYKKQCYMFVTVSDVGREWQTLPKEIYLVLYTDKTTKIFF